MHRRIEPDSAHPSSGFSVVRGGFFYPVLFSSRSPLRRGLVAPNIGFALSSRFLAAQIPAEDRIGDGSRPFRINPEGDRAVSGRNGSGDIGTTRSEISGRPGSRTKFSRCGMPVFPGKIYLCVRNRFRPRFPVVGIEREPGGNPGQPRCCETPYMPRSCDAAIRRKTGEGFRAGVGRKTCRSLKAILARGFRG